MASVQRIATRRPVPAAGQNSNAAHLPEWAALALIAVAACVAYWPARSGGMLWDDDAHVTAPELQSLGGLARIWFVPGATQQYYPLLHSAFWLEHALWGEATLGYHLVNLLLHLGAAYLVFLILRQLAVPGALLAAAIFALHPVQVETVAWITEQKNTLSAVFYLGAMLAYLRFDDSRRLTAAGKWYWLALGLFLAGLLCKTVTATLPAALLVIFWWQRGTLSWRRDVGPLVPFFAVGAVAGIVTAIFEQTLIGAKGADFDLSLVQRLLLAGRVEWFYLEKLVRPADLTFFYPRWEIDPTQAWQWLFPAATAAVFVALWALRHTTRAPLAGWLFFVGTLFPVLGLFNVYPFRFSFVADHFQYLACLGIIVPVSAAIVARVSQLSRGAAWLTNAAGALLVAILAALSWQQSHNFADAKTLYEATLARNPRSWLAYNQLGLEYHRSDRLQEAFDQWEKALQLKPDYAEARNNLAGVLVELGRPQEAVDQFEQVLKAHPKFPEAHVNLADTLVTLGRNEEAVKQYEAALQVVPMFPGAHNKLGRALFAVDRPADGLKHFEEAVRLRPDYEEARENLGVALFHAGQPQEAIAQFEEAVRLQPNSTNGLELLGRTLAQTNRPQDAIPRFQRYLKIKPDDAEVWFNLASVYGEVGRGADALAAAQKAITLARAQGNTALAEQIEATLSANSAATAPAK